MKYTWEASDVKAGVTFSRIIENRVCYFRIVTCGENINSKYAIVEEIHDSSCFMSPYKPVELVPLAANANEVATYLNHWGGCKI